MSGGRKLEVAAAVLGIFLFALIMILIVMHGGKQRQRDNEIIARCDYLVTRSEASIARWNHGRD